MFPQPHDAIVDGDPLNPRPEVAFGSKSIDLAYDFEECFLKNFLGIGGIFEVVQNDAKEGARVAADELVDDVTIVTFESFDDRQIVC